MVWMVQHWGVDLLTMIFSLSVQEIKSCDDVMRLGLQH